MKLLTISIPTYNRHSYLSELLDSIQKNTTLYNIDFFKVEIYDNNSTDDTEVAATQKFDFECIYHKNLTNIGMLKNIEKAYTETKSHYTWVIGDDDMLPTGAINNIIACILKHQPGIIISKNTGNKYMQNLPAFLPNYSIFAKYAEAINPYLLVSHSLISCNIIHNSSYDKIFHETIKPGFLYDSHCAIIHGLAINKMPVCHIEDSTLMVRERRAAAHYDDLNKYHNDVIQTQYEFLCWEKELFSLTDLDPSTVVSNHDQMMTGDVYKFLP